MTSRELFNGIMHTLDSHSIQLAGISQQNSSLERKVSALGLQNHFPMIARPIQGVDYMRTCNIANYVDKKIKAYNNGVAANAPRYMEFAPGRSHDELNRSALATVGGILIRKLGNNFGVQNTWEKLYRMKPQVCEEIIEEARMRPELTVFSQVDGQWCFRELAKNKLKSLLRGNCSKRISREHQMQDPRGEIRNSENVITDGAAGAGGETGTAESQRDTDGVAASGISSQLTGDRNDPNPGTASVETSPVFLTVRKVPSPSEIDAGAEFHEVRPNNPSRPLRNDNRTTGPAAIRTEPVRDTLTSNSQLTQREEAIIHQSRLNRVRNKSAAIPRSGLSSRQVRPRRG